MAAAPLFDTMVVVQKLELAGMDKKQAEVLTAAIAEILDENVISKKDGESLKESILHKIEAMHSDLNLKFSETHSLIYRTKYELIIWAIGFSVAVVTLILKYNH